MSWLRNAVRNRRLGAPARAAAFLGAAALLAAGAASGGAAGNGPTFTGGGGGGAVGGSAPPTATGSGAAAAGGPLVWIGAPYRGNWAQSDGCPDPYPSEICGEPQYHHVTYAAQSGTDPARSWAADIYPAAGGAQIRLYAQLQKPGTLTATVLPIADACSPGKPYAGKVVVVALAVGGTRVGTVAYAHIEPSVTSGQSINPWGTVLGTVGSGYTQSGCWKGVHTHVEMGNVDNYACYNGGWDPWPSRGQRMFQKALLGYIGGNLSSTSRADCQTTSIYNIAVCPQASMNFPHGWPYLECADDYGASTFSAGSTVACSIEAFYATAHKTGMKILKDGSVIEYFQDQAQLAGATHWFAYVRYPHHAPAGSYQCQALVDGVVTQTESFSLTGS